MSQDLRDNELESDISPQEPPPVPWWVRVKLDKPAEVVSKGDSVLADLGLNQGLSASRWAGDHRPIIPTRKARGMPREDSRASQTPLPPQDHVPPHLRQGLARGGLPVLTVNTKVPQDDNIDVVMGENTPTSPVTVQVLKDADGDIIMQDLDDQEVTSQINQVLEGERVNKEYPMVGAIPADPSSRPRVVKWVLVVDTSFILSHLHLVNNLVTAYACWGNVVMLPWATIMELDGLKKSNSMIRHKNANGVEDTVSVGMLARRANSWSFDTMSKKAKGLWGQMKEEVLDPAAAKGDTAILDCCRYVKEKKRLPTAILSNDKNLCVKALIYGITAICFQGSVLTADGIMSILEGPKDPSYLPAGIWSSLSDINKPVKEVRTPYYARAPDADKGRLGLYSSRHAHKDAFKPRVRNQRYLAEPRPFEDRPHSLGHMVENESMVPCTPVFGPSSVVENARPVVGIQTPAPTNDIGKVKCHVGVLLVRIEADLIQQFLPLVKLYWDALPVGERNAYPELAENITHLEGIVWKVTQFKFDRIYPNHEAIRQKIRNGDLAFNWNSWVRWTNPELTMSSDVRPRKPTSTELIQFIQDWEVLWVGMVSHAPPEFRESLLRSREVALASWKSFVDMLIPTLDG